MMLLNEEGISSLSWNCEFIIMLILHLMQHVMYMCAACMAIHYYSIETNHPFLPVCSKYLRSVLFVMNWCVTLCVCKCA